MILHYKKIIGNKVYLSPRSTEDAEKYTEWLNNFDVAQYIVMHTKIMTVDVEREYLGKVSTDSYDFAIVDNKTDELIGSIGLEHINNINRTAELGVFIGDNDHLSCGYGSEAIMLILDYGFNFLNLNNIMLRVFDFNIRAIKAYKKCGFKEFGVWKDSHYAGGQYHDVIYMNITRDEFNKNRETKM